METNEMTPEQLATQVKADFAKSFDSVKELAEKAIAEAAENGRVSADTAVKADEALIKMNALIERQGDLEQKLLERMAGGGDRKKSLGEQFVEDGKVKEFLGQANPRGRIDMQTKATLTSLTTDAAGSVGDASTPTFMPTVMPIAQRRLTVRDLLSVGQMDGGALEYVKETGFVNNAAPVAEAAAKPASDIKLDIVSTTAKVLAHYMKASRQVLSDIAQLRSIIDQRLLFGLAYVEETQLLNGDGTGQNLLGIIPQATAYVAPFTPASPQAIDTIRLMMLQAALAEYPATGVVMHPTDWARMELTKNAGGDYIIGNPQGTLSPSLWGLPVVTTQAITIDKALVGAFKLGAQIFDRWQARVEIATENEDDFIKNLVTILAEERLALAVYRPESFIYADLGFVA